MDPKAITTRSSAGSRGAIAAFLAAVSLALVGLLVTNNPIMKDVGGPAIYLCAALWVAAALTLIPTRGSGSDQVGAVAVVVYAIAFILPAATFDGPRHDAITGYLAYAAGLMVVPLGWLANPLFLLALATYRRANVDATIALAVVGGLLALTVPFTLRDITPSIGFIAWAGAQGILILAAARESRSVARTASAPA